jgi:hypothetical protein
MVGLTDEEREETWNLLMEVQGIKYPPGPTPEQEITFIRIGKIINPKVTKWVNESECA